MDLEKLGQSVENIFLELHGYLARFEKVTAEIERLKDKSDQLSDSINSEDDRYTQKSNLVRESFKALDGASFEAVALTENLVNVVSNLEDAHQSLAELAKLIEAEKSWKANARKARKSAFY